MRGNFRWLDISAFILGRANMTTSWLVLSRIYLYCAHVEPIRTVLCGCCRPQVLHHLLYSFNSPSPSLATVRGLRQLTDTSALADLL